MEKKVTFYTPNDVYGDFKPRDDIKYESKKAYEKGICYETVCINGREVEGENGGTVSIYGKYAYIPEEEANRPAVIIIPDTTGGTSKKMLEFFVKSGYNVFSFDYAGDNGDEYSGYTGYPSAIQYAEFLNKDNGFYKLSPDADGRRTCWYEWCCVARYAVSFVVSKKPHRGKIGVLGIKTGADIMWHLIATDERLTCAVALFGAGWRAYKGKLKYAPAEHEPMTDEQIRYIACVDSHSFAPYCKCPVALFTTTNSAMFDADRAHDTIRRVNPEVDSFFCLSPRMKEVVDFNCMRNVEIYFSNYLNGRRVQMASEPKIDFEQSEKEKDAVEILVTTSDELKPVGVDIYVCEGELDPSKRNWIKLKYVSRGENSVFSGKYRLINGGGILFAFAVVVYRNGITVSTAITSRKCPETAVIKTNLLYKNTQGEGDFTFCADDASTLDGAMYFRRSPIELVIGPMGITGISSSSGLTTYKVGEKCVDIGRHSIFELDLYCREQIVFLVRLYVSVNGEQQTYYNYTPVNNGEVWQNIIMNIKDFKNVDGLPIPENITLECIDFSADGFFAINNVLLI